jgi:3-dehydroquinate synthase
MKIALKTPTMNSDIYLGEGVIGEQLPRLLDGQKHFVLTDSNVYALHRDFFDRYFLGQEIFVLPAGEEQKNFSSLQSILEKMVGACLKRTSKLFAVGGGMVGDVGGLSAALYMRGIEYVQIPTTLLAMVDSSVGGKTAVDLCGIKNAVGAFHQPKTVLIDPSFLSTLPDREWKCGIGEIVKYAALDTHVFDALEGHGGEVSKAFAVALIEPCIRFKAGVVLRDERESGERKCLNVGHTTAHALELAYGLSHGESVLLGMKIETALAMQYGVCRRSHGERILAMVERALSIEPRVSIDYSIIGKAVQKAALDKKNTDGENVVMAVAEDYGKWTLFSLPLAKYVEEVSALVEEMGLCV